MPFFLPRRYRALTPSRYLAYLLIKLNRTLEMYTSLRSDFAGEPDVSEVIAREERDAVSALIRLQYVLGWSRTTPYREDGILLDESRELDHVIPVTAMTREILRQEDPEARSNLFVRAWLSPVALISRESHRLLKNDPESCLPHQGDGFPFNRYVTKNIVLLKCDDPLTEAFSLHQHYLLLAGLSAEIRDLLIAHRIITNQDLPG